VLAPEAGPGEAQALARDLVDAVRAATGAAVAAGIACFPAPHDRSAGALLAEADAALAVAWQLAPPVALAPRRRHRVASRAERIAEATTGSGIVLERAPVVELRSGETDHLVLAPRPRDPALARPDGLRTTAERFGLGRAIDRWLVERGLEQAARGATIVVPLAGPAVTDPEFCDWLVRALAASPRSAARLVLAVEEPVAVRHVEETRSLAARSAEFSTRLALEGFGRLAALALVRALPVHHVRLHASLVHGLPVSDADRAIALAAVQAAEAVGAVPVATGVAGPAELTAVRGFGIRLAQGAAVTPR
jgi:diguanylate cyclase